jgi:drug/metabolite transporter (DMT)-like permease
MSNLLHSTEASTGRSLVPSSSREARRDLRRLASLGVAVVVLVWSIVELVNLGLNHNTGPELYGILVAALSVVAGALSVTLLRSSEKRFFITVAVLILWAVIALGGIAGVVAHIVGPVPGHGPIDTRPRPVAAPLIFTALGVAGSAALFFGKTLGAGRLGKSGEE